MRKFIATNIGIWLRHDAKSAPSSTRSTTRSVFIRRSAICHPQSSKPTSPHNERRSLRGHFLYEFLQASGNLSIRCDSTGPGAVLAPLPGLWTFPLRNVLDLVCFLLFHVDR